MTKPIAGGVVCAALLGLAGAAGGHEGAPTKLVDWEAVAAERLARSLRVELRLDEGTSYVLACDASPVTE